MAVETDASEIDVAVSSEFDRTSIGLCPKMEYVAAI
jgi:hypothetical protein